MKISVRTLKQEKYEFECEPTDTILRLKQIIFEKLQHEVEWQTLIFSGVLLANDRTIESCKISEKDFLVLMVKKPAQPKKPEPAKETPSQPSQPVQQPVTQPVEPKPSQPTVQPSQPTQVQPAQSQPQAQPAQPQAGNAIEAAITSIVDMGFPRDMVMQAMQSAGNNPDVAVSILTGELPFVNNAGGQRPNAQPSLDIGDDDDDDEDEGDVGEGGPGVFDALKNTPHFQQLRILARQNPAMLEQILTQLPRNLVELISQNQEEFLRVLQEEPILPQGQQMPQMPQAGGQQGAQQPMPQQIQVRLTPEDQAMIQNLMDMTGCEKNKVMQAYILFERDAEQAANYLLNHGFDDEGY
jgi:UV excision repair protein RAD23